MTEWKRCLKQKNWKTYNNIAISYRILRDFRKIKFQILKIVLPFYVQENNIRSFRSKSCRKNDIFLRHLQTSLWPFGPSALRQKEDMAERKEKRRKEGNKNSIPYFPTLKKLKNCKQRNQNKVQSPYSSNGCQKRHHGNQRQPMYTTIASLFSVIYV